MIRATAATWLNHGTTLIFQIVFAFQFGTSPQAGAFVVAFAAGSAVSSVFVSTAISVAVPRMTDPSGKLKRPALNFVALLGAAALALAAVLALLTPALAHLVSPLLGVPDAEMVGLLVVADGFFACSALFGILGSVLLAQGRRFLPALAPAMPTAAGAAYVIFVRPPSVTGALVAVAFGALLQLGISLYVAGRNASPPVAAPPLRLGTIAALTAAQFALFGVIPILQRVVSAVGDPADAVRADYAFRGIIAAQQLLVGGLALAALPRWANRDRRGDGIGIDVASTTLAAGFLVISAATVALVIAPNLAGILFERGAFLAADSSAVGLLVRVALIGFVAEALSIVFLQGVLAKGRNDLVLRAGFLRLGLQIVLTLALGLLFGAVGVAVAYSISLAVAFGYLVWLARGIGLGLASPYLSRSVIVWIITAGVGLALMATKLLPVWFAALATLGFASFAALVSGLAPLLLTVAGRPRRNLPEPSLVGPP